MFVKICGITSADAIDAAAAAGADAVGFVFAASPRQVSPRGARALAAGLPKHVIKVAVFRHPERALVADVLETLEPDWLQSDAADFAALELPPSCRPLPVYRGGQALDAGGSGRGVAGGDTLAGGRDRGWVGTRENAARARRRRLLFEGPISGSGRTADWREARELAAGTELILAGGLGPGNVADAIRAVRPWGVDVSSGVERERGRKDPAKIAEFVAKARAAAEHELGGRR